MEPFVKTMFEDQFVLTIFGSQLVPHDCSFAIVL
jgi:hypothetical protein